MPVASTNKYEEKRLVFVKTRIVNIPSASGSQTVGTPIKYGFWTNVDNFQANILGHTLIPEASYSTPQAGLVIGATFPKPSRASKKFAAPIGIISTYCSDSQISALKAVKWNVARPKKPSPAIIGSTSSQKFVKSVYVTLQEVKYGWHMPLATAAGIGSTQLTNIGIKDVAENDKDEVVFGANIPRPPRAKAIVTVAGQSGTGSSVNSYTTFYDPSKENVISMSAAGDFDWIHVRNGIYVPRP